MLQLCRAEDGHVFQVNATLRDIEATGSLEYFLQQQTGVDEEACLAYLSDGRRLRNDNVRELAGSQDQSIYVFNKCYLDYNLDEVLRELHCEAPLQPSIEDEMAATPPYRASQVAAAYVHTATAHRDHVDRLLKSLRYQHEAIRIACSSLDMNVLAIVDAFEGIAGGARTELDKQAKLLAGLDIDLDIISRIAIHADFMSPSVRRAIDAGEKQRTLGDYVSNAKMRQVAETCSRTHDELRTKFTHTDQSVLQLINGTEVARASMAQTSLLDDAEACSRRSNDLFDKIVSLEGPASGPDDLLPELKRHDIALRHEVQSLADTKNLYTAHCINVLRHISAMNKELVQLPSTLASLQTSFRGKNSFSHIQRLHNMLYAYGATVIEVVRRKEFSRFFNHRAQSILEVMAKLSASERKRRQIYRGEVHGQLPFDTKGMDDPVPIIDFSPANNSDAVYSLERQDVDALMLVLEDLEKLSKSSTDSIALSAVRESRDALERLVTKMDSLESGFDRIAERSLLSASRLITSRRRSSADDDQAVQEILEQLRASQRDQVDQETRFNREREILLRQVDELQATLAGSGDAALQERERVENLEDELDQVRKQLEIESAARRIIEDRNHDLSSVVEGKQEALNQALSDATEQTKIAEGLREELLRARKEFDEVKALEVRNAAKFTTLLDDQTRTLRNLEEARLRGDDLEVQIQHVRTESEDVHRTLREVAREKDRLLRAQASEHDRLIRDHIAEADGDRAVLEHQFSELQAVQEDAERHIKDLRAQVEVSNADAVGLREELQRVERELREARHAERVLRDDLNAGRASQSDFEQRLEDSGRLVAQILDVAISFSNSHVKAMNAAHAMSAHPNSTSRQSMSLNMADSILSSSGIRHGLAPVEEPAPIDPSDPSAALDVLRAFDHDQFLETLGKTGLQIKKWQKQCKEYRERAKGKISFRNFTKGDLALFLPTRNSVTKPWAAFNVSFPHYFLQATGRLGEQLKTREWIVARITSITERVVDHHDPLSNPYGLGDGVKYYVLEVEDWSQPTQQSKRRVSRRAATDQGENEAPPYLPAPAAAPIIPETEVETSFTVTQPPTSQLFPVRSRSDTSPTNGRARPSSLSRILAQAPPETPVEPPQIPGSTPPPATSPLPSPVLQPGSLPHSRPSSSPFRPASRASRLSTSSRISFVRGALAGASVSPGKSAPTTALAEQTLSSNLLSSSPSSIESEVRATTPSPAGSISEDMSTLLSSHQRRRTTSYHSPLASTTMNPPTYSRASGSGLTASVSLANLASSWGVSFGRRKRPDLPSVSSSPEENRGTGEDP